MTKSVVCFPPIVSVGEVFDVLQQRQHHCFPVTAVDADGDSTGVLLGTVARKVNRAHTKICIVAIIGSLLRIHLVYRIPSFLEVAS